jgi:hypothetical protein
VIKFPNHIDIKVNSVISHLSKRGGFGVREF